MLDKFPDIVTKLGGITERFCTAVDCVDVGFLADGTLDELPQPSVVGAARVSGIDLNKPRIHRALTAVLALAPTRAGSPSGNWPPRSPP